MLRIPELIRQQFNIYRALQRNIELMHEEIALQKKSLDQAEKIIKEFQAQPKSSSVNRFKRPSNTEEGTIEELKDKIRKFELDLFFREEAIKNLRDANAAIIDQFKNRFALVQTIVPIVAFLFVINFSYQVYKTHDVEQVGRQVESALTKLQEQQKQMSQRASILGQITQGIADLNSAQRAEHRLRPLMAIRRAESASRRFEQLYEILDNEKQRLDMYFERTKDGGEELTNDTDLILTLHDPVKSLLLDAYDMEAHAHVTYAQEFLPDVDNHADEIRSMARVADKMKRLDAKRWEGYHYWGLYLADKSTQLAPKTRWEKAKKEYEQSIALDREFKLDLLNLAEAAFRLGYFDEASKAGEEYLTHDFRPTKELKIVANFFVHVGKYLARKDNKEDDLREFYRVLLATKPDEKEKEIKDFDIKNETTIKDIRKSLDKEMEKDRPTGRIKFYDLADLAEFHKNIIGKSVLTEEKYETKKENVKYAIAALWYIGKGSKIQDSTHNK